MGVLLSCRVLSKTLSNSCCSDIRVGWRVCGIDLRTLLQSTWVRFNRRPPPAPESARGARGVVGWEGHDRFGDSVPGPRHQDSAEAEVSMFAGLRPLPPRNSLHPVSPGGCSTSPCRVCRRQRGGPRRSCVLVRQAAARWPNRAGCCRPRPSHSHPPRPR